MNEELIREAFNEGTMRLANLPDLAVGTRVITGSGYQGEALVHHADQVVFGWDNGVVNTFTYNDKHCVYLAPLFFVEGKPVYKGDVLYGTWPNSNPNGYEITGKNNEGWPMSYDALLTEALVDLTWTKPVININGHDVPLPERKAPDEGTEYFFPSFQWKGGVYRYTWSGDAYDNRLLSAGMVHLTEEAAEKHAEALASFTRKQ